MNIKIAESICGTLSNPSKMPCHGYSIPASRCKVGMRMRNVKNSICSVCYALKGRYVFPTVQAALEKRWKSIFDPEWINAIVFLIGKKEKSGFFRWHDSGDIQSEQHLTKIVCVARFLPMINFWLPTREYSMVANWIAKNGEFPSNLTVRLSGLMLDGKGPEALARKLGLTMSSAHESEYNCPSFDQGGKCLTCRKCWDKSVFNVIYKKH